MISKNKKIILLFFLLLLLLMSNPAQARELEIDYPSIPGVITPENIDTPLTVYLAYLYNFAIVIAGVLSFVFLVWGGIDYISSTGNITKLMQAKEKFRYVLLGLLVILSSGYWSPSLKKIDTRQIEDLICD